MTMRNDRSNPEFDTDSNGSFHEYDFDLGSHPYQSEFVENETLNVITIRGRQLDVTSIHPNSAEDDGDHIIFYIQAVALASSHGQPQVNVEDITQAFADHYRAVLSTEDETELTKNINSGKAFEMTITADVEDDVLCGGETEVTGDKMVENARAVVNKLIAHHVLREMEVTSDNVNKYSSQVVAGVIYRVELKVGKKVCHIGLWSDPQNQEFLTTGKELLTDCSELLTPEFKVALQKKADSRKYDPEFHISIDMKKWNGEHDEEEIEEGNGLDDSFGHEQMDGSPSRCKDALKTLNCLIDELNEAGVLAVKDLGIQVNDITSCQSQVVQGLKTSVSFHYQGKHCSLTVWSFMGKAELTDPEDDVSACPQLFASSFKAEHGKGPGVKLGGFSEVSSEDRIQVINQLFDELSAAKIFKKVRVPKDDIISVRTQVVAGLNYRVTFVHHGKICRVSAHRVAGKPSLQWDNDLDSNNCPELFQKEVDHQNSEGHSIDESFETYDSNFTGESKKAEHRQKLGGKGMCTNPEKEVNDILADLGQKGYFEKHLVEAKDISFCTKQVMDGIYYTFSVKINGKKCEISVRYFTEGVELVGSYDPKKSCPVLFQAKKNILV